MNEQSNNLSVIIPAYNEEDSIQQVINAIPLSYVQEIIVVDNASSDRTASFAKECGATIVYEPQRGYGSACLAGIQHANDAEILVFLDADFSDDPSFLVELVQPILKDEADLVIGSRIRGDRDPGALPLHAMFGNRLACFFIWLMYGYSFTDLGPFRAIRRRALDSLKMGDRDYGWTVEMQIKSAMLGLRCCEIPVPYRKRVGRSKISGTISGSVKAGNKILWTLFSSWIQYKRGTFSGKKVRDDV